MRRGCELFGMVICLVMVGTASATCFDDPTAQACSSVDAYYNADNALDNICTTMPWVSGCTIRRQCTGEQANKRYCSTWSLLASTCPEPSSSEQSDPQLDNLCLEYRQLCHVEGTAVAQCSQRAVPNMITTPQATLDVIQLCVVHPSMEWCVECTDTNNAEHCQDPLHTLASICLDHYMEDCARWYDMCREFPEGLDDICGNADRDSFVLRTDDGDLCVGIMKMYFHSGLSDYVLFRDWVPCTNSRYMGFFFFIVFLGVATNFVKGLRARLEQHWARQAMLVPPPAPAEGKQNAISTFAWHFFPTNKTHFQQNLIRAVFTAATVILDYALMLISMTFNVGFFFAVVLGYALGSLLFAHTSHPVPQPRPQRASAVDSEEGPAAGGPAGESPSQEPMIAAHPMGSSSACCNDYPG